MSCAPARLASRRTRRQSRSRFFSQAEAGIRDKLVTGVQTCALPIFLEQLDPRLLEPVARGERVQVARDVEPERQAEDLPARELRADALGVVALEDPEVLLEDLAERPVGDPAPVGQAAAGAA